MSALADAVHFGLHVGQAEVKRDPARFKVVAAGRRWGKSKLGAITLIEACLTSSLPYRYVGPTLVLSRKAFWRRVLRRMVHPSWLAAPPNQSTMEMQFVTGATLDIMGADNPDSLRAVGIAGVVMDEYADMDGDVWPEAVRPSLGDHKGWALFIGTPKSYNHFHTLWDRGYAAQTPLWRSWQFRSVDNPLLDPGEIDEARRTTDPRSFRQEWEASFEALSGRAYYAFSRQHHVRRVDLIPGVPVCVSFDFNIHPATAVIGQGVQDEARIWREVWITHAGGEATRASALAAKRLLQGWSGPIRVYGDPSGKAGKTTGPSDHAILREVFAGATFKIAHAQVHPRDRVAAINSRCETLDGKRHVLVDPSCAHVIADFEQVTFKDTGDLDKTSNPLLTHVSDAAAYWIAAEWPVRKVQPLATIRAPKPNLYEWRQGL